MMNSDNMHHLYIAKIEETYIFIRLSLIKETRTSSNIYVRAMSRMRILFP